MKTENELIDEFKREMIAELHRSWREKFGPDAPLPEIIVENVRVKPATDAESNIKERAGEFWPSFPVWTTLTGEKAGA